MFKSEIIERVLFGINTELKNPNSRRTDFTFPFTRGGERDVHISYPSADGLVLYLLRRMIKSEDRIEKLEKEVNASKKAENK